MYTFGLGMLGPMDLGFLVRTSQHTRVGAAPPRIRTATKGHEKRGECGAPRCACTRASMAINFKHSRTHDIVGGNHLTILKGLLCVSLLLTATLAGFPAANAVHANDVPLVWSSEAEGTNAAGLAIGTTTGKFFLDAKVGPHEGSVTSAGVIFFNEDRSYRRLFVFSVLEANDQVTLSVPGGPLDMEAEFPGVHFDATTSATDATCPRLCLLVTVRDAAPGTHYFGLWGGGGSTTLEVHGEAGTTAAAEQGTAYVGGDETFEGILNAQVGRNVYRQSNPFISAFPAAKVIVDASRSVAAEGLVYGVFATLDVKLACQFTAGVVGACYFPEWMVDGACKSNAGISCSPTQTSWTGPNGMSGSGAALDFDFFFGTPAGAYEFTIDRKIDVGGYAQSTYWETGSIISFGRDVTWLSMADITLPA